MRCYMKTSNKLIGINHKGCFFTFEDYQLFQAGIEKLRDDEDLQESYKFAVFEYQLCFDEQLHTDMSDEYYEQWNECVPLEYQNLYPNWMFEL